MARTSRRSKESIVSEKTTTIYSVGIYARLSVDSHNEKNDSIDTQIEIAKEYLASRKDMILYDCYSDLGKTGTNFERDGFERLMSDVRKRFINCVIVKDFSRFGRNYIEVGNYLEKIFPFMGVRFISITDGFDSLSEAHSSNDKMSVNLKNLVNEMYAKDIAVKVKRTKQTLIASGNYLGSNPPYGYYAAQVDGKRSLFIEDTTSEIVKKIYAMYAEGNSLVDISKWLYANRINRPRIYHQTGVIYHEEPTGLQEWGSASVKFMLTNPVYAGILVQGRTSNAEYKNRKRHDVAAEDWCENQTHEAIIDSSTFFQIAERFEKQTKYANQKGFSKAVQVADDIFAGLLYCGECGSLLTRTFGTKELGSGDRVRIYAYRCYKSRRIDEFRCSNRYITLRELSDIVLTSLKTEFALSGIRPKRLTDKRKQMNKEQKAELLKARVQLDNDIKESTKLLSDQYRLYRMGNIEQEMFVNSKLEHEANLEKWHNRQAEIDHEMVELDLQMGKQNEFLRALVKFDKKTQLDAEILRQLIKRIDIYPNAKIEIHYRFTRTEILDIGKRGR